MIVHQFRLTSMFGALMLTAGLAGGMAASQISTGIATPAPTTAPPATAVSSDSPGTVHGRVLAADTGAPLRAARVELTGTGSAGSQPFRRTAVTDRQGQYRLEHVPPGRYTISASRPGFVPMQAGQKHPLSRRESWTVKPSATDRLDFVLPRGGVIAGRLTDTDGEPLPGIRLTTLKVAYSPNGERLVPFSPMQATSDDRGAFRVAGLGPGTYLLVARSQSDETGDRLMTTYYPGTTNPHEAERFEIAVGEQISASFSMREGRPARVSGYVRSSNGSPLQDARLALRTDGGVSATTSRVRDASGAFELTNVAPGNYILDVSPTAPGGMLDFYKQTEFASVKVSVGTEDITGFVVTTGPGTTVAGRVIYESLSSPRPRPSIPQVFVEILDGSPGMRSPSGDRNNGRILEDGTFTVKGGYGSMLFRAGWPPWLLKSVSLRGQDITDVPYDATLGDIDDLEIVVTDQPQVLKGSVVDKSGKPVNRFVVAVFPSELPEGAVPGRFLRLLSPRADGTFDINNLPPGNYLAAAFETIDQDVQWNPAWRETVRARATSVYLAPGQIQQLELSLIE